MIDVIKKLRIGMISAINTAMTANSKTCPVYKNPPHNQTLPYIHLPTTLVLPRHNKTHEGTETYPTLVVYADDPDEALDLADITLQALTDRDVPITVDASVKLITWDLDSMTEVTPIPVPEGVGEHYGVSIRLKQRTHE